VKRPGHVHARLSRPRSLLAFAALTAVAGTLAGLSAGVAHASPGIVVDTSPGTAAPPGTLGPYTMTSFAADPQAAGGTFVSSVAAPTGGSVGFNPSLAHYLIGSVWATWSHGYTGDVYADTSGGTSTVLTMPANTGAFYLYVEPNEFATFTIEATAQDGTTTSVGVNGNAGAQYFGFYGTGGDEIVTITVEAPAQANGYAVGEFGIATVVSNLPPDCSKATASPNVLWPPDHRFRTVKVGGATDPEGGTVTIAITGVTQDEPLVGWGSGNTSPDALLGATSDSVSLRAERAGIGNGRVYRVAFTATDPGGLSCNGVVTVGVPHDWGGKGGTAVDSGGVYTSSAAPVRSGGRGHGHHN
jgi:hypothetical protein